MDRVGGGQCREKRDSINIFRKKETLSQEKGHCRQKFDCREKWDIVASKGTGQYKYVWNIFDSERANVFRQEKTNMFEIFSIWTGQIFLYGT